MILGITKKYRIRVLIGGKNNVRMDGDHLCVRRKRRECLVRIAVRGIASPLIIGRAYFKKCTPDSRPLPA